MSWRWRSVGLEFAFFLEPLPADYCRLPVALAAGLLVTTGDKLRFFCRVMASVFASCSRWIAL